MKNLKSITTSNQTSFPCAIIVGKFVVHAFFSSVFYLRNSSRTDPIDVLATALKDVHF